MFGDKCSHHSSGVGLCFCHLPCYLCGFTVAALHPLLRCARFCVQPLPQIGCTNRTEPELASDAFDFTMASGYRRAVKPPRTGPKVHLFLFKFISLLLISLHSSGPPPRLGINIIQDQFCTKSWCLSGSVHQFSSVHSYLWTWAVMH